MQFPEILRMLLLTTYGLTIKSIKVSSECVEQLQRCSMITEEYERLIQEIKQSAFRNCFSKETCIYEWTLFEDCFGRSVRAVRASLNRETPQSDNFGDSANRYLTALENCFGTSQEPVQFPDFTSALIDEDAIYARTIYSTEYADRLWGLPQLLPTHPYLDSSATMACLTREKVGRVFGNGINRYIDSADPNVNNLNNSCILEEHEIQCYRRRLSNDGFYQELLIDRDRVIRSCIRSVRLQTQCHAADGSRIRACLCSAREEFENRVQASILQCVRRTYTNQLHRKQQPHQQPQQRHDENLNKLVRDTGIIEMKRRTVRNGQCLCTCPNNGIKFVDLTMPKHQMQNDVINDQETDGSRQNNFRNMHRKAYQNYYNGYLLNLEARRMVNGS